MIGSTRIAWLQLRFEKVRLLVALLGVSFAVILILMQLGFQQALFVSAARFHSNFSYDLAMYSPKMLYIVQPRFFARARLVQARGVAGVRAVAPVYLGQTVWEDPADPSDNRNVYVVGFDPSDEVFTLPGVLEHREELREPDVVLFDALSRAEYGPVPELLDRYGRVGTEIASRWVEVVGTYQLGTSFGIDATVVTNDLNFRRLFPERRAAQIDLGLIHLEEGADPQAVKRAIRARVAEDVGILTRAEFIEREVDYWRSATPIGLVLGFGVAVGITVGSIIVYQILFADVSDHVREYATLKAMGYTDRFLSMVVIKEALILAVLGFVPGFGVALLLYRTAEQATQLPMTMTAPRVAGVLALTIGMCCLAGAMALRKVRKADPAEVF